jgi:polyhydroxybutyrate depolymerase
MESSRARVVVAVLVVLMLCTGCVWPDGAAPPAAPDAGSGGIASRPDASPAGDAGGDTGDAPVTCSGLADVPANQTVTIESGGVARRFRVYVPPSYEPTQPMAVVLNFHGLNSSAGQQVLLSGMSRKAEEAGFIAVHPEGRFSSWNGGGCCGRAASRDVDDVGFVADMLAELEAVVCVDSRRVYATGMSNGGFMSHRLGCEMADRIAAIAPVGGTNAADPCEPTRAVPVLQIHGTDDRVVPYGEATITVSAWAARNDCNGAPEITFEEGAARCRTRTGCRDGAEVTLCSIAGFGHWWPGAFGAAADLPATDAIWDFFTQHALP